MLSAMSAGLSPAQWHARSRSSIVSPAPGQLGDLLLSMQDSGLIEVRDGAWTLTPAGREAIAR